MVKMINWLLCRLNTKQANLLDLLSRCDIGNADDKSFQVLGMIDVDKDSLN
jgi:hypothetical protein